MPRLVEVQSGQEEIGSDSHGELTLQLSLKLHALGNRGLVLLRRSGERREQRLMKVISGAQTREHMVCYVKTFRDYSGQFYVGV